MENYTVKILQRNANVFYEYGLVRLSGPNRLISNETEYNHFGRSRRGKSHTLWTDEFDDEVDRIGLDERT